MRNSRIQRSKSSGVLVWGKKNTYIYIFFLRVSRIVRRKSSSTTLKTAIRNWEFRFLTLLYTNVTHVPRWQQRLQKYFVFNFILFQFLPSFFFFFLSSPSPSSLFLSDFDQGWKDYICWSRDALLSHQQFIADDNIFWANNKNTGTGDVVNNWTEVRRAEVQDLGTSVSTAFTRGS